MDSVPPIHVNQQPCSSCGKNPRVAGRSQCRPCINETFKASMERNQHKPCAACGNKPRMNGQSYCRECKIASQRVQDEKRRANGKNREKERNDNLKRMYGITMEVYDRMLVQQRGVCAICGQAETRKSRNGTVQPLSVDHNHVTGQIRGLLCHDCNWLVGAMELNPKIIQEALLYLQKHLSSND
jgi:hypothetical protein